VATSVVAEVQDSHGGGLKATLRRSWVTGWDGAWRGGTAVSLDAWELNYIIGWGTGPRDE